MKTAHAVLKKQILISFSAFCLCLSAQAADDHHGEGGKAHRDNAALFPQPKADLSKGTPPEAPQLSAPALGTVISSETVALSWRSADGATDYHVQVATDPNFKWLKVENHWVKDTQFEVSGLEKGHRYYWRVASWKKDNVAGANKSPFRASSFEVK